MPVGISPEPPPLTHTPDDERWMDRALRLAERGLGWTRPNPAVGAVVVRDGQIVGEGFHLRAGMPHAEVNALAAAGSAARGATLYVTLEPCSHFGRTPPCAEAVVQAGLGRVVVAAGDPNPKVCGRGLERIRQAGIPVTVGVLEQAAVRLNEGFMKHIATRLPFVVLKMAMSLDGKIATSSGESQWITSAESRSRVHRLRAQMDAVMVGVGTVLKDDPRLTARTNRPILRQPIRVVVDSRARTPVTAAVLASTQDGASTIIAVTDAAPPERIQALRQVGALVWELPSKEGRVDLEALAEQLGAYGVQSLLCEGGGTLADAALRAGIVDKVLFMIAPMLIGGKDAPTPLGGQGALSLADAIRLEDIHLGQSDGDVTISGYIKASPLHERIRHS